MSVYARIFNFPHDLKTMFFLDPAQIFPDHRIAVMCHIHAFDPAAGSRLVNIVRMGFQIPQMLHGKMRRRRKRTVPVIAQGITRMLFQFHPHRLPCHAVIIHPPSVRICIVSPRLTDQLHLRRPDPHTGKRIESRSAHVPLRITAVLTLNPVRHDIAARKILYSHCYSLLSTGHFSTCLSHRSGNNTSV